MRSIAFAVLGGVITACSTPAAADILFEFSEVGNDVVMISSGTFDTTGLNVVGPFTWGLTGIEENGNHDIMGGTDVGQVDISFAFNDGTDFSQWATANGPWSTSDFNAQVTSGQKGFATYVRDPNTNIQIPGLGVERADLDGPLWTPDQNWRWTNESFATLQMHVGTYSVSDSITGETITIRIVPAPAAIGLLGIGLGLTRSRRRR